MNKRDGRTASQRQLRVGEEIRHVLAQVLARDELRDPDLMGRTITVTEVRISPDLKNATAFIVPLNGEHGAEVLKGLKRCSAYLRGTVGREVRLRAVPRLSFELDVSFDQAQRIEELLHRPEVLQDIRPPASDEDDEAPGA
ncbi:MAG TPA: 30S ribosome-binding factor RbfA [Aliidongia sp.]|uniref:30S ribosome-binding factor RbfA n=1 Tax=Aliidongia sp. TaxID=1914230 RepID=UPI002DDD6E04|nr:30S ribosome-binding factor RbfA [Aliidongia sp.]HEV2673955.1 30S ribosome-binding factor RbfA [Aliidongia sp.]